MLKKVASRSRLPESIIGGAGCRKGEALGKELLKRGCLGQELLKVRTAEEPKERLPKERGPRARSWGNYLLKRSCLGQGLQEERTAEGSKKRVSKEQAAEEVAVGGAGCRKGLEYMRIKKKSE